MQGLTKRELILTIPGIPHAQGRPRATNRGKHAGVYKDKDSRQYEQNVAAIAFNQLPKDWELIEGAIELTLIFKLVRPKSVSEKKRPLPIVKPDLDNLIKSIKDGLNGIVWHDDKQIVLIVARKQYDSQPGVNATVEY